MSDNQILGRRGKAEHIVSNSGKPLLLSPGLFIRPQLIIYVRHSRYQLR